MDINLTRIFESLLGSGPLAGLLFYQWWTERIDRKAAETKLNTYLEANADKTVAFVGTQREVLQNHTRAIEEMLEHVGVK